MTLLASDARACQHMAPDLANLDDYSSVFVGTVTGIHLVSEERHLLGEADMHVDGIGDIVITNGANEVHVNVVPRTVLRGKPRSRLELQLSGCTTKLPALRERGLFFRFKRSDSAITVWESDAESFARVSDALGLTDHSTRP